MPQSDTVKCENTLKNVEFCVKCSPSTCLSPCHTEMHQKYLIVCVERAEQCLVTGHWEQEMCEEGGNRLHRCCPVSLLQHPDSLSTLCYFCLTHTRYGQQQERRKVKAVSCRCPCPCRPLNWRNSSYNLCLLDIVHEDWWCDRTTWL